MDTMWKVLTRKKILDPVATEQSQLGRVLSTIDLTFLGVGSTLGVGVYVLAGHVAKDTAGPAVILSFLIATVASVFAGLCYAEFGARAPRAGSAYIYSYVCVGEFIAFVIGWNLILEYVIGSASVARGLSLYVDTLVNNTLKDTFEEYFPITNVSFMSAYFDFFAFGISLLLAVALAFGLKESSLVNNIFTVVNLLVVGFVIIAGAAKSDTKNWHVPANATNDKIGDGGFFPFGVEGMIKGAATCFYGFVGFDCIATTGEEVRNPKRAIPVSIVVSLTIIFLAYFGTSTVVTLMVPYYEQDPNAPLPHAFATVGMEWAKWVVAIGGIFGLCASLFGAMFPLPRIIYAMASDSIIFRFLGQVSTRFKTPVVGTLLAGLLTGLMAAIFELKQLVNMMSIGTLLAYTIVAASVLLLRHEADNRLMSQPVLGSFLDEDSETYTENRNLDVSETDEEVELISDDVNSSILLQIFNCGRQQYPSEVTEKIIKIEVCLYCALCVGIGLCAMYLKEPIGNNEIWAIVITAIVVALAVLVLMSMITQPKSRKELSFKVPLVPLIPALSILINIYLMLMLDAHTWIRFGVWMAVGIPTYYFSVKKKSDARNESICSLSSITANGKIDTFTNHSFDEDEIVTEPKKRPAPPPPTSVTAIIADLDEMLENVEANLDNEKKYSVDSLSNNSYILHKENVQADVHCSDLPPAKDVPLLESNNVTSCNPVPDSSDVADSFVDQIGDRTPELIPEEDVPVNEEESPDATIVESADEKKLEEIAAVIKKDEPIPKIYITVPTEPENSEEIDGVSEKDVLAPIPTPPPFLVTFDDQINNHIPRPTVSALTAVKLKPIPNKPPETPPIDYHRHSFEGFPIEGNIKSGTPQYQKFREKLEQVYRTYVPQLDLKKKPVVPNTVIVQKENVVTDAIDRYDAKEKLAKHLLERTNSLPPQTVKEIREIKNPHNSSEDREPEDNLDNTDYKEQHRQNMQSIFKSVKLKKQDSFPSKEQIPNNRNKENQTGLNGLIPLMVPNGNVEEKSENNDYIEHRKNMDNIFKSIRLKKKDSFKQTESQ